MLLNSVSSAEAQIELNDGADGGTHSAIPQTLGHFEIEVEFKTQGRKTLRNF